MKQIFTPKPDLSLKLSVIAFLLIVLLVISKTSGAYGRQDHITGTAIMNSGKTTMGALPVVLTPLKGYYSKGVSRLYWSSLQESNSNYFEIQRSNDGITYFAIDKVNAKGLSDREVDYTYHDIKANPGKNYYRLKLFDRDGKFQFSNIEVLNVDITGIFITGIYPGPFVDKVNVTVSSEVKTQADISLFDNTGKLLVSRHEVINTGVSTLVVDKLDGLSKGFY